MINIFLVIFLKQKVGFIFNPIRKVSLSILLTTFWTTKKKNNLDFIFNNFPVHRTDLWLIYIYMSGVNWPYSPSSWPYSPSSSPAHDLKEIKNDGFGYPSKSSKKRISSVIPLKKKSKKLTKSIKQSYILPLFPSLGTSIQTHGWLWLDC